MLKLKEKSNKLTSEDIKSFIENLNSFSDEEITRWLKAVKEHGLDINETTTLTLAMANSGQTLSWKGFEPTIDKHSTGGIGDKVTLLFVPLLAACGVNVPKLSGRGLGITGGTIDKLESIKNYRCDLTLDEIKNQIKNIGLVVTGTMKNLAPADKRIYAIRDVTNTIDSIPLIASSVMSKKIAAGSGNIILDVKYGSGAFMKDIDSATQLAQTMVNIGKNLNKNIRALVTNMNEPLGYCIGNSLEIEEVLNVLSGKKVNDLIELTIALGMHTIKMLNLNSISEDKLRNLLLNGEALKKFEEMVKAQGGDLNAGFKKANFIETVKSKDEGYIENINALKIGEIVHRLGAGRNKVSDTIDHSVGIKLNKKSGDYIKSGEPLLELHAKNSTDAETIKKEIFNALIINDKPSKNKNLIECTI